MEDFTKTKEFKDRVAKVAVINVAILLGYTLLPLFVPVLMVLYLVPMTLFPRLSGFVYFIYPVSHAIILLLVSYRYKAKGDIVSAKVYTTVVFRVILAIIILLVIGFGACFLLLSGI